MPIRKIKSPDAYWRYHPKPCFDREHKPPKHIVIRPGEILEHECPACKKVTILDRRKYTN